MAELHRTARGKSGRSTIKRALSGGGSYQGETVYQGKTVVEVKVQGGKKKTVPSQVWQGKKIVQLLGGKETVRHPVTSELDAHEMLLRGLPTRSLTCLIEGLTIIGVRKGSKSALEHALGISWRTVQRRKNLPEKLLNQEQSGRTWKFAEVLAKATEVFGSQSDAEQWMERPAIGLDQRCPIDLITTPAGADLVETFLERLEYGVYS